MRSAALEVLAGTLVKPIGTEYCGLEFDNFHGLRAGIRIRLEQLGLIPPLVPKLPYWPSSAFAAEDERTYRAVWKSLVDRGTIILDDDFGQSSGSFRAAVLPTYFSKRWQFVELLNGGGQSDTYKVCELATRNMAVLKMPKTSREVAKKRFRREVDVLSKKCHPAIIRMLDACSEEPDFGLVTPYGIPLEQYWAEKSDGLAPSSLYDTAYTIVRQLADGVAALHAIGVAHRDLKPPNVVMVNTEPRIIDLGVAGGPEYEADDLTSVDGQHVENGPIPYYWKDKERDIVGLAWIYGLLIEKPGVPKHRHCQWQAHEIVEEPRATRARALLAACSVKTLIPQDVASFVKLMDDQLLGPAAPGQADSRSSHSVSTVEAAELAHAETSARAVLRQAEESERVDAAIQVLDFPISQLRERLAATCTRTSRLPVTPFSTAQCQYLPASREAEPMGRLLRDAYEFRLDQSPNGVVNIFARTCAATRPFHVAAVLAYTPHFVEDALQFRLLLWCHDGQEAEPNLSILYAIRSDGTFRNEDYGGTESHEQIADRLHAWMLTDHHWAHGLPPRRVRVERTAYQRDLEMAMLMMGPHSY